MIGVRKHRTRDTAKRSENTCTRMYKAALLVMAKE